MCDNFHKPLIPVQGNNQIVSTDAIVGTIGTVPLTPEGAPMTFVIFIGTVPMMIRQEIMQRLFWV